MAIICEQCGKSLKSDKTLKTHVDSVHQKLRNFVCPICSKAFFDRGKLNFHQHKHSEVRNFHCEECNRSFKTKADLYQHYEIHDKGKTFTCEECGLEVAKRSTYEAHLKTHLDSYRKPNSNFCRYCNKVFRNPCDVQRHIDSIHEKVINFVCPICNKGFTRKDRFVEHTELHKRKAQFRPKRIFVENATVHLESDEEDPVENGEFPCDSCNQSYSSLKGVTTHKMRLHETLNKFQCEECPETFFLRNDLNTHEEDIHGKIKLPEIFKCEECGEEFLDITVLYKHYSINHPKTTFKCSNCNLEFTKLSVYKIHMRRFKDLGRCFNSREDPERIFSCNICEKAYKTTDYLKKHRRLVHEKIRNYVCDLCHAAFMNHCEYKNHMLNRHSKKTSFVCEECGEGFKIKNELNKHFQIHDKGKIFSCSLCPKTYTKRSSYEVHLRRHEIIKNRTCEECGEVCRDMKKIAWHMRKVHGQTGETYICDSCGLNFVNKSSLLDHMNEHFDLLSSKIKLENNLKQEFNLRECHIKLERIDASEKYDLRNEWEEFIETTLDVPHFEQLIISTIKEEQGVVFKEEPEEYFLDDDTGFEAIHGFDDSDNDTNFPGDMEIVKLELKTEESDEEENEPLIKLLKGKKSIKKVAKKTKRQPKKASAERPNLFEKDFENKIIECEICDKVFTNVPSLRTHIYRLHNKNPDQKVKKQEKNYVCPVCQHRHYSKQSLDEHYRAVHDKAKDFVCEVCNLDFAWKNGLNRHKCAGYKVQERKPYKPGKLDITCRENKEMFEEKIEVKTESEAESETNDEYLDDDESGSADEKQKEKARCDLCDVAFDNKRLLQKHNYRNHNLNTKMIKIEKVSCFYCCLEFNSKASLRQHRHRKHNKNPASTKKVQEKASCEICSLEFNSKDSLRQHKTRKHSAKNSKGMVKSQCSICELWFNSKEALGMHKYRKHNAQPPPKKPYCKSNNACEFCGNTYHSKQNLDAHQRAVHLGCKDYTCYSCNVHFGWEKSLKSHNEIHHRIREVDGVERDNDLVNIQNSKDLESKQHNCSVCSKSFMTVRHVTRHNMLVHEKQHLIFCSFCEETFRSREDLKSHSKEVHSKDCVVDCPFCEHSFTNQDSCDQHEIDIHDMVIRYFSCDLCDKSCTSKVELAKHKLVVHVHQGKQQKRYCVICKEACIDYHARLRHMKLIHDGRKKLTRDCMVCQEKFTLAKDFFAHIAAHEGCAICEVCGVDYGNPYALQFHKKVHRRVQNEEKKICCDTCGKKFHKKANLLVHMAQHTGEKQFVCDQCGKCFRHQSNLCTHKQSHNKVFECNFCQKILTTKQMLQVHVRTHTGFRPYACDMCDKKYTAALSLKFHKRKHAGVKLFKCHLCTSEFNFNISLRSHLLKVHAVVQEKKISGRPANFKIRD